MAGKKSANKGQTSAGVWGGGGGEENKQMFKVAAYGGKARCQ